MPSRWVVSVCVSFLSTVTTAEEGKTLSWLVVSEVSVYHSRDGIAEYLSGGRNVWPRFVRMDQEFGVVAGTVTCGWSLSLAFPGCWPLSQRTEHKGSRTQGGFAQCKTAVQVKEDVRIDSRLQHRECRRALMTFWASFYGVQKKEGLVTIVWVGSILTERLDHIFIFSFCACPFP